LDIKPKNRFNKKEDRQIRVFFVVEIKRTSTATALSLKKCYKKFEVHVGLPIRKPHTHETNLA
jgi:hypothetical protein